ncbi:MAG: hypothetical protein ABIE43_05065 [Patescibacteria group bacterium]
MIVDEASGRAEIKEEWSFKEMAELFKEAGFKANLRFNKNETAGVAEFINQ